MTNWSVAPVVKKETKPTCNNPMHSTSAVPLHFWLIFLKKD